MLNRLIGFSRKAQFPWRSYLANVGLLLISSGLMFPLPLIIKRAIDGHMDIPLVLRYLALATILTVLRETLFLHTMKKMEFLLREFARKFELLMIEHYHEEVFAFSGARKGHLINQIHDDAGQSAAFFFSSLAQFIKNTSSFLFIAAALLWMNFTMAAVSMVPLAIFMLMANSVNQNIRKLSRDSIDRRSILMANMHEAFQQSEFFRITLKVKMQIERLGKFLGEYFASDLNRINYIIRVNYPITLTFYVGNLVAIFAGIFLISTKHLEFSGFIATLAMVDLLYATAPRLVVFNIDYQQILPVFSRVESFLDIIHKDGETELIRPIEEIQIAVDSFGYAKGSAILKDIRLTLKSGDRLGIRGSSGSGKSTLAKILMGMVDGDEAAVFINGERFSNYRKDSVWRRICYMPQEPVIFSGSKRENICFDVCAPGAEDTPVLKTFISDIDSDVFQEFGKNISGGQKQRISLLRAFVLEKDVLLFDEPTNYLDNKRAEEFISLLELAPKNCIVIMISHDDRVLSKCTKVLELPMQVAAVKGS